MTCENFDTGLMGGCGMAWLGFCIIFLANALLRKWGGEEMGISYNFLFGIVGGFIPYLIIVSITASYKWALLAGLAGMALGGYLLGQFIGGDE